MCAQSATAAAEHDVTHTIGWKQLSSSEEESAQARDGCFYEQAQIDLSLRLHWACTWFMCGIKAVITPTTLGLSQPFVGATGLLPNNRCTPTGGLQRPG